MTGPGLPGPPLFDPDTSPEAMLAVWGALALSAVIYAVVRAVRDRDALPVAACVGAAVCALNEPIYDILGKLVYAQVPDAYVAYEAFGREIPWTLVIGYVPWVGLVPYLVYRLMARGTSRRTIQLIGLGLGLSVLLVEVMNSVWLGNWQYYGEVPLRGVLAGGVIQMASMPLLAALLYLMLDRPSGQLRRVVLGIIVPSISLPMAFAATSWPIYFSNYAALPAWVDWAAAGVAVALCIAAVLVIARLSERWHEVHRGSPGRHLHRREAT